MTQNADLEAQLEVLTADNARLREELTNSTEPDLLDILARDPAFLEAFAEGVVIENENGTVLASNRAAEQILGLTLEEMISGTWIERWQGVREDGTPYPPDEHPSKTTLTTGNAFRGAIMGIRKVSGKLAWVSMGTRLITRRDGTRAVATTYTDITTQREISARLEESENRLQSTLAAGRIGVWEWDIASGRISWTTPTYTLFDVDPSAPVTYDLYQQRLHADDRASVMTAIESALEDATATYAVEHRVVRRNGDVRWVRGTGQVLRAGNGEPRKMLGATWDVTDQRLQQERRLQSQRMEAIGQLAGGIAHDFNNVLTAVLGALEEARFAANADETLNEALSTIDAGASHAVALTRQLLAFARKQVLSPKHIHLDDLVDATTELLRHVLSASIELKVHTNCSPWTAHIDPTQLQQVLVNLAVNARDAMPNGGTLTIRATKHVRGSASIPPECAPGDWLNIEVEDDGCGIPEDVAGRIFEPFFSTKPTGTGLGLATSFGIVEQSGGLIECRSKTEEGTRFAIWLPRSSAPGATVTKRPSATHDVTNATILVVEDQTPVLEVVRRTLTRAGFEVIAFRRPEDAIKELERRRGQFDLLLSDVVMPEMSGPQLANIVRHHAPGMNVLFMSGYSGEHLMQELHALEGAGFIKKPFRPHDLIDKIKSLLARISHDCRTECAGTT